MFLNYFRFQLIVMRIILSLIGLILLGLGPLIGQVIEVGLIYSPKLTRVSFQPETNGYELFGDGKSLGHLIKHQPVECQVKNDRIYIKSITGTAITYKEISFRSSRPNQSFRIVDQKITETFIYPDHLIIRAQPQHMQLINRVNIENYVGGVVEAEAGKERDLEYYKVQSIISRTYALANFRRHSPEGFQLCNKVHCQVYHGKSRFEPLIPKGVMATRGVVLVDDEIALITAAFSSNCGGKTRNSEEVWSKPLSYLKAVSDTFCLAGEHAEWQLKIGTDKWKKYQHENLNLIPLQSGKGAALDRTISEFQYGKSDLNAIRSYFSLNSTRFVIEEHTDSVTFIGRGFGHGVGLCQEGAMAMARQHFTYQEILNFYYTNIHLIELTNLGFFKWD